MELGIGPKELGIDLIEPRIGLIVIVVGLRVNNASRTVFALVSRPYQLTISHNI